MKSPKLKSVRIDANTLICVDPSISDEEARNRFLAKLHKSTYDRTYQPPPVVKKEIAKVENMGSLEELAEAIEESEPQEQD